MLLCHLNLPTVYSDGMVPFYLNLYLIWVCIAQISQTFAFYIEFGESVPHYVVDWIHLKH